MAYLKSALAEALGGHERRDPASVQRRISPSDGVDRVLGQYGFGFDLLEGLSTSDKTFLHRMFNRRHLFSHCGGMVDQEYLDRTGDGTVRLHQVVTVSSAEVRRLLSLVGRVAGNLLDGFESVS